MLEKDIKKVLEGVYPFHMPGHKRAPQWLEGLNDLDITEISGADDLHAPSGIIAAAQSRAAALFGTLSTIFLTGGSTAGILSAIWATCRDKKEIVIARNCHRSVYNACMVSGLDITYAYPTLKPRLGCYGEITAAEISAALDKSGAKAVVITSPTYEGIISDIKAIERVVHKKGAILIVDSAHGAHLGLHQELPKSARSLGADIVIESAHKTLPCVTGSALLHICSHRVSYSALQDALGIFETSSPPYPIMASMDRAITRISGEDLFTPYIKRLKSFYEGAKGLKFLSLATFGEFDPGKLIISTERANISGFELKDKLLSGYGIETEMAMPCYTLAMTSIADTDEGFDRLLAALTDIDKGLKAQSKPMLLPPPATDDALPIYTKGDTQQLSLKDAYGRFSAEAVYAYPPGSPIIAQGEKITSAAVEYLTALSTMGGQVYSSTGGWPKYISVFGK